MNTGWILVYRKLLEWEWYNDPNTLRVFLHLLLKANHKAKKWQGTLIQTGQLITGRLKLVEELKLSERQIRTALEHLKSTNEITIKTTSQYSIITINNWNQYQQKDQQNAQQPTKKRPTKDHHATTNNNDNNVNNEKEKEDQIDYESLSR